MALQIRKAQRRKAKLRLALIGPTGSGKTMSALRLSFGIGGKVGCIDTENGSADLYADVGDYDVITLEKPYTVEKYREALTAFEDAGYDVIIIDSLTHAWSGAGGLLDQQGQREKQTKNSFTAWREITPMHAALVEAMLTSPAHIIATLRVKTEYVLEEQERNGRRVQVPRKVGLAPVFRDGIEYEFVACLDVDADHRATASKDRTRLFDGFYDTITERTGQKLREWLESGEDAPKPEPIAIAKPAAPAIPDPAAWLAKVNAAMAALKTREQVDQAIAGERIQAALRSFEGDSLAELQSIITAALDRTEPSVAVEAKAEAEAEMRWPGEPAEAA